MLSKTETLRLYLSSYVQVFDETFEFRVILPELALLRFVVLDDDHIGDCFIGQCTIPIECIRQGTLKIVRLSKKISMIRNACVDLYIIYHYHYSTQNLMYKPVHASFTA